MPPAFVDHLFPSRYGDVGAILPWSALGGLAMGAVNLTTTYFQAAGHFRRTTALLAFGVALCAGLEVVGPADRRGGRPGRGRHHRGHRRGASPCCREAVRLWPGALGRTAARRLVVVAGCLPLVAAPPPRRGLGLWVLGCGLLFSVRALLRLTSGRERVAGDPAAGAPPRLRGPGRPGAGAGRCGPTRSTAGWPTTSTSPWCAPGTGGPARRVEDGVRYVHVGLSGADFPERLSYFAGLPLALLRYPSDLVSRTSGRRSRRWRFRG